MTPVIAVIAVAEELTTATERIADSDGPNETLAIDLSTASLALAIDLGRPVAHLTSSDLSCAS